MQFRVLQSHVLRLPAISARLKGAALGNRMGTGKRAWPLLMATFGPGGSLFIYFLLQFIFFYIDISWEGGHNDDTHPPCCFGRTLLVSQCDRVREEECALPGGTRRTLGSSASEGGIDGLESDWIDRFGSAMLRPAESCTDRRAAGAGFRAGGGHATEVQADGSRRRQQFQARQEGAGQFSGGGENHGRE